MDPSDEEMEIFTAWQVVGHVHDGPEKSTLSSTWTTAPLH